MYRVIQFEADGGAFVRSKAKFARHAASLTAAERLDYGATWPACPAELVGLGEAVEEIVPASISPGELALEVTDAERAAGGLVGEVWRTDQAKRAMTPAELADALTGMKAAKRAAISAAMGSIVAGGFDYEVPGSGVSHSYQVDASAQVNMTSVAADFALGAVAAHGGFWRSAANVNVAMADAECIAFLRAAKAWKQAVIRRYWELLAAVEAVADWADRGELDAIDAAAGTISGAGGWSV